MWIFFKKTSVGNLLLLVGWTIGPFLLVPFFVAFVALLGWPPSYAANWISTMKRIVWLLAVLMPPILGFLCFVKLHKPRNVQWLIALPYFFIYGIGCLAEAIAVALEFGAPM